MLAYFEHFMVPGVPDIEVFRDHANPAHFWVLNNTPHIATDAKSGMPLFNFTLFSRNIEIAYASTPEGQPVESQLGALNMTVDLSITEADKAKILKYLKDVILKGERSKQSVYNKLYKTSTTQAEPTIAYVQPLAGTVRLDMLEGLGSTFKRSSSQDTVPSLTGTNRATLWATFGSEGAQLMWGSLNPKKDANGKVPADSPMQANITYRLDLLARLPNLRVEVHADGEAIYKEIRKRVKVTERVNDSTWTYPQVSELTKALHETRALTIQWDDWGIPGTDPKADEIKGQLEAAVMGIITNNIVTLFFKPFEFKGLTEEDLGETFTHSLGGKKGSRLWLNEFKEEFTQDIDFTLEKGQNFKFPANPQTSLLTSLTDDQRAALVRIIDVGSPEIRVMTVHVYTNADFQNDKIANITTTLTYKQFDTLVNDWIETSESYVFKTGQEVFTFRTRLARDRNGKLIDFYDAKAQVHYIGTSQSPAPIELKKVSERALTFSYDRLGYVKVEAQAGDIDWNVIKEVFVDLVYDAASTMPDAKGTIKLNDQTLKGSWTSSKHGRESNRYTYTVRYLFKDGREVSAKAKQDDRGTLVIHDTLVGRLRRTFDVLLDQATVSTLSLKVRYEDPPNTPDEMRQSFTETGSWEYVRPLRENGAQDLKYAYDVQYKDGQAQRGTWEAVKADQELKPIQVRRYRVPINIEGGGLDWTKWRLAVVEVTYEDKKNEYIKIEEVSITKEEPRKTIEVFGYTPQAREYQFRATLVPVNGAGEPVEVPADGTTLKKTGMLLLETLV